MKLSSRSCSSSSSTTIVSTVSTAIVVLVVVFVVSTAPGSRIGVSVSVVLAVAAILIIVVVIVVIGSVGVVVAVSSSLAPRPLLQSFLVDLQNLSVPFKGCFLVFFQGGHDRCDGIVVYKGQHTVIVEIGSDDLGFRQGRKGLEHVEDVLLLDVLAEVFDDQCVVGVALGSFLIFGFVIVRLVCFGFCGVAVGRRRVGLVLIVALL